MTTTSDPPGQAIPATGDVPAWKRLQAAMLASKLARSALYVLVHALAAYHLEATAGIAPAVTQSLVSLAVLVQFARPLLAAWSDARPVLGSRRKWAGGAGNACFLLSVLLFFTGWSPPGAGVAAIAAGLVAYGAGDAFQDVAFDSWLLDVASTPARKGRGQLVMRLGAVLGTVLGYGAGGLLVDAGWDVFVFTVLCVAVASTATWLFVPEPRVTRDDVLAMQAAGKAAASAGERARAARLAWSIGLFIAVPFAAEGLADVMLEPWLIDRLGAPAPLFFGTELAGSLVALAVIGALLAVPRFTHLDLARMLVVLLAVAAWYYIAAGWLSPDLGTYMAWNAMKFAATMLVGVAVDRMLMDAVRGAWRGTTFQLFALFVQGGSLLGTVLGPAVAAVLGMEGVLVLAAGLLAGTGVAYAAWFKPALARAVAGASGAAGGNHRDRNQE